MADIVTTKDLNVKDDSKLKTGDTRKKYNKAKAAKDLKKFKSKTELYLYEVEKCVKAGGKSMECKLKVRDIMDEEDRKKKAKKPKEVKKK
jgi:hypothetical protein